MNLKEIMKARKQIKPRIVFSSYEKHGRRKRRVEKILEHSYFDAAQAEYLGTLLYYMNRNTAEPAELPCLGFNPEKWESLKPEDIAVIDDAGNEVCDYNEIISDWGTMDLGDEVYYWKTPAHLDADDLKLILNDLGVFQIYPLLLEAHSYNYLEEKETEELKFDSLVLNLLFKGGTDLNDSVENIISILFCEDNSFQGLISMGIVKEHDPEDEDSEKEYCVSYNGKKYQMVRDY